MHKLARERHFARSSECELVPPIQFRFQSRSHSRLAIARCRCRLSRVRRGKRRKKKTRERERERERETREERGRERRRGSAQRKGIAAARLRGRGVPSFPPAYVRRRAGVYAGIPPPEVGGHRLTLRRSVGFNSAELSCAVQTLDYISADLRPRSSPGPARDRSKANHKPLRALGGSVRSANLIEAREC